MSRHVWVIVVFGLAACGGEAPRRAVRRLPRPDSSAVREFVGGVQTLRLGGDVDEQAMRRFARAAQMDANLWEANYNLGVLALRRGRTEPALGALRAAVEAPHAAGAAADPRAALALAEVLRRQGQLAEAESVLRRQVQDQPQALDVRNALARVLRQGRSFDDALGEAREVLIRDGRNLGALNQIGVIYYVQGQYDLAELVFKKALAIAGTAANAAAAQLRNNLGLVLLARGDDQAAFVEFARSTEIDPSYATARLNRAAVLLRSGDFEGASTDYRAAAAARPEAPEVWVGLGIALRGLNRPREARDAWERALRLDRNNPSALYDLGVLHTESLRDPAGGARYLRRYLEVAPSNDPKRTEAERYVRAAEPRAPRR